MKHIYTLVAMMVAVFVFAFTPVAEAQYRNTLCDDCKLISSKLKKKLCDKQCKEGGGPAPTATASADKPKTVRCFIDGKWVYLPGTECPPKGKDESKDDDKECGKNAFLNEGGDCECECNFKVDDDDKENCIPKCGEGAELNKAKDACVCKDESKTFDWFGNCTVDLPKVPAASTGDVDIDSLTAEVNGVRGLIFAILFLLALIIFIQLAGGWINRRRNRRKRIANLKALLSQEDYQRLERGGWIVDGFIVPPLQQQAAQAAAAAVAPAQPAQGAVEAAADEEEELAPDSEDPDPDDEEEEPVQEPRRVRRAKASKSSRRDKKRQSGKTQVGMGTPPPPKK